MNKESLLKTYPFLNILDYCYIVVLAQLTQTSIYLCIVMFKLLHLLQQQVEIFQFMYMCIIIC